VLEVLRPLVRRLPFGRDVVRAQPRASSRVLRSDADLRSCSMVLARDLRHSAGVVDVTTGLVEEWLRELHAAGAPALFAVVTGKRGAMDVVVASHDDDHVVFSVSGLREETPLEHAAPNGAYIHPREWRQLGFLALPPEEPAVIVIRATAPAASRCVIDVPRVVGQATVIANHVLLARAAALPAGGELRLRGV